MNFLGWDFAQALTRLRSENLPLYRLQVDSPPRDWIGQGELLIIRERELPEGRDWVLAYRRYCRWPGKKAGKNG